jgi:hypothetical protein
VKVRDPHKPCLSLIEKIWIRNTGLTLMACESGAAVAAASGAAATSLVLLKRPPGSAILRFLEAAAGTVSFMGRPAVATEAAKEAFRKNKNKIKYIK